MSDPRTVVYLTKTEALKYIKRHYRKGITYFVRGSAFLYTTEPSEGVNARGYADMSTNIAVSQKVALKYVNDLMRGPFEDKGCKIEISDYPGDAYGGSMFIG